MTSSPDQPRIIIVDDSEDDFFLISRQISKHYGQANIVHALDEEQLLLALYADETDLVICDYSMPLLTHERTADIVQSIRPDTPVILLSGMANEALGARAMNHGVRDYVEKSKLERLIPAIQREINTYRLRREKTLLEQAHRRAVYFDTSSGLLNRAGLIKTLSGVGENHRQDVSLFTINFARNLARGPEVDPKVRRSILDRVIERVREIFQRDILARWSDNLLVVVKGNFKWQSSGQAELDFLSEIESRLNRTFIIDNIPMRPAMRLGFARLGPDGLAGPELVSHAQAVACVLEADNANFVHAVDESVHRLAKRRKQIELGLAKGIESQELVLDFQPIEDLKTGKVVGLEALVRWTHPELGRIMPGEFIGVAEDSGLIEALGLWVIRSACSKLIELHAAGFPLWCAVNCSPGQLLNPEFPEAALQAIRNSGLEPKWIEFEVTESAAISDMNRTVVALNYLKDQGSKIAMDDFGTGYASLNYLRHLPIDVVKIDKSFVMDLLDDKSSHMIVKAVIDLAHALGLTVHAEGIESEVQRKTLLDMGCDRLQGYWLAKPQDTAALRRWLSESGEVSVSDPNR